MCPLVACSILLLSGCQVDSFYSAAVRTPSVAGAALAPGGALTPWLSLTGGTLSVGSPGTRHTLPTAAAGRYVSFVAPCAVAARGQDVYIVDSGLAAVFRYDTTLETMTVVPGLPTRPGTRLYVMGDSSLLVLDQVGRRVLHVTRDGIPINNYSDDVNLAHPVDMTVDEQRGLVLVADGLNNYIVAFHLLGRASSVIVPMTQQGTRSLSIAGIAATPQGLFVLDRLAHQVLQLDSAGHPVDIFGQGVLQQPKAIAADHNGRVVVIDAQSSSLKIFVGGELLQEAHSASPSLGDWHEIWYVSIDDMGSIYVADRASARIDILRFTSPRTK